MYITIFNQKLGSRKRLKQGWWMRGRKRFFLEDGQMAYPADVISSDSCLLTDQGIY